MTAPYWLNHNTSNFEFPPIESALTDPNGLLAVGGDLSPDRLLQAYRQGIFPWFSDDQPILWWSPDPRAVAYPSEIKISRSLKKTLRKNLFQIKFDTHFKEVIEACAAPRTNADGTWLTDEMQNAYLTLFKLGHAHSIEVWQNDELVGGLYGIAMGRVFFGESMFSRVTDASKIAFVHLAKILQEWNYALIDCQVTSEHMSSLGAVEIPRHVFIRHLANLLDAQPAANSWHAADQT